MKGLAVVVLAGACLFIGSTHAQPVYRLTDAGSLGGRFSLPMDINNRGHVAGFAETTDGARHAFLFRGGEMEDLGTLPGHNWSSAAALNDRDEVVGSSAVDGINPRAFRWRHGRMIDLGVLSGDSGDSASANDINNRGQIVGFSAFGPPPQSFRAFLYKSGRMRDLGSLDNGFSIARAINRHGEVVGASSSSHASLSAFLYTRGTLVDIGALVGGPSVAIAMNDKGHVIGVSGDDVLNPLSGVGDMFLYKDGTLTILLPFVAPTDINNTGQIVGSIPRSGGAFLYQDGVMHSLEDLVDDADPLKPTVSLQFAAAINEWGQIASNGAKRGGGAGTYILTPVSYPRDLLTSLLKSLRGARHHSELTQTLQRTRDRLTETDQPTNCLVLSDFIAEVEQHGRTTKRHVPIVRALVRHARDARGLLGCIPTAPA
jgi:probable HAF family extracellular repeat protein